jgi:hypothetical protein
MKWLRSWWQQIKKHRVTIGVVGIVLVVGIALIIAGYWFDWTGFKGKTLWDWLNLLGVLAIPAVVGLGAAWYTARQNHDFQITLDNQRETALQTYLDKMSDLLLHENLSTSKYGDNVANIAHARTFTVLPQLDPNRKRSVILFLAESELIMRDKWIIDMSFADLRGVNLSGAMKLDSISLEGADLEGANLSSAYLTRARLNGANLHDANFSGTDLFEADLSEANLSGATLSGANLFRANLNKTNLIEAKITNEQLKEAMSLTGAILPEGKKHA